MIRFYSDRTIVLSQSVGSSALSLIGLSEIDVRSGSIRRLLNGVFPQGDTAGPHLIASDGHAAGKDSKGGTSRNGNAFVSVIRPLRQPCTNQGKPQARYVETVFLDDIGERKYCITRNGRNENSQNADLQEQAVVAFVGFPQQRYRCKADKDAHRKDELRGIPGRYILNVGINVQPYRHDKLRKYISHNRSDIGTEVCRKRENRIVARRNQRIVVGNRGKQLRDLLSEKENQQERNHKKRSHVTPASCAVAKPEVSAEEKRQLDGFPLSEPCKCGRPRRETKPQHAMEHTGGTQSPEKREYRQEAERGAKQRGAPSDIADGTAEKWMDPK